MSDFSQTQWADSQFAQEYRDTAEQFIPHRSEMFRILRSFVRTFGGLDNGGHFCDLGCGDGIVAWHLLQAHPKLEATLVDGFSEMLAAARKRLAHFPATRFAQQTFAEWTASAEHRESFRLIVSAFAIHHLDLSKKARLFTAIHSSLEDGGWFINIDTTLPDQPRFTDWYYRNWQEWVDERDRSCKLNGAFNGISEKARNNPDNKLNGLRVQLDLLRESGFQDVDCLFKNGLFTIFAGQRGFRPAMHN